MSKIQRSIALVASSVIAAASLTGASATAAPAPKPKISSFSDSQSVLARNGGTVVLRATVASTTAPIVCVVFSNIPVAGLPAVVTCSSGTLQESVTLPANLGKRSVKYKFQLSVTGGVVVTSKPITVTVVTTATAPGPPTVTSVVSGNEQATVHFNAPLNDGDSPVTSYVVMATDLTNGARGGETSSGATSPLTVPELTNGDSYTFTVAATNALGTGPPSDPSAPTIPAIPPVLNASGTTFGPVPMQLWSSQAKDLFGIDINWTPSSSASGLDAFAAGTDDFAASDLPFGLGVESTTPDQPYQYLPTASSGLAFMFNLNGNDGQRITNLNLNPLVIAQIFLGEITNWNSPQIAVANPQLAGDLPNQTIYPVYRTDASGDNYLLSDYLLHQDGGNFTAAQNAFQSTLPDQPAVTWPIPSPSAHVDRSLYPGWVAGNPIGENGPANAANYVAAPSSVGSITYVETGYAEAQDLPVANLANASGANVQPTALNVATALEAASLQPGHTQDLTNVYTNPLPDVYPLSSVSYMIAPCSPSLAAAQGTACDGPSVPTSFPAAKGQALGQFVYNMACAGQQGMANLGLSPLPPNLVQDDFNAIGRLVGADEPATPTATNCANPTIDGSMPLPT